MKCPTLLCCLSLLTQYSYGMHMIIKSVEHCNPEINYDLKMYCTLYMEGHNQFLDSNVTFAIPLDNEMRMQLDLKVSLLVGPKYVQVVRIDEPQACNKIHKFLGEFAYDIERASGSIPRLCPIPRGRYQLRHHLIETNKITLQSFPFGSLLMTMKLTLKKQVSMCLNIKLENLLQ